MAGNNLCVNLLRYAAQVYTICYPSSDVLYFNNFNLVCVALFDWLKNCIHFCMDEKNQASHAPLLELLFVVTESTQSKLIGTNSSSH